MRRSRFSEEQIIAILKHQEPGLLSKVALAAELGNQGCFFGEGVASDKDCVVFASVWKDLSALKARFGEAWQTSFLPPGYDALIDECSVRHIDLSEGWKVDLATDPE
ncbi:hypothetical protein [Ovoidimarina sediminis]|uniref:hypothetical protein n=1 Tax=Ovoidimarina sediminis TaxID=3079856 RepID=UPI002910A8EB|nr:hypothetical protein [Rhodophyticola sp. MJ-SS7]MDU8945977.1 hypothetical protein [Rhodophyticola sp. MJ-SS7]